MKRLIITFALLFSILGRGKACGPFERSYLAQDYFTFRVCGDNMSGVYPSHNQVETRRLRNCEEWQRQTSAAVSVGSIDELVYQWNIDEVKALQDTVEVSGAYPGENQFAQWIVAQHRQDILDFLLVAKTCEKVRKEQTSEWYYPVEGDSYEMLLDEVIRSAKEYRGSALASRYHLQAIRAYFGKKDYTGCVNYWLNCNADCQSGVLREMMVDYVAGALLHMDQQQNAFQLYQENGYDCPPDIAGKNPTECFAFLSHYDPDHPWLLAELQRNIHKIEREMRSSYMTDVDFLPEFSDWYQKVSVVCNDKNCKEKAPWLYAKGYLADRLGKRDEAWKCISKAEKMAGEGDLKDAIHTFKIILRVKRTPFYDAEFENRLFPELVWLDNRLTENLDDATRAIIQSNGIDNHICGYSQYYWSDMMRKILIAYVAPLCIKSHYQTRALEYLNFADNRLSHLVDSVSYYWWDEQYDSHQKRMSWKEFRSDTVTFNNYDYSNDFFMNLDSIGVVHIERQVRRMQNPQSPLEHFLTAGSYTDVQFFYDIIGTQLLAAMRYEEAEKYLSKVSVSFNASRNVKPYCEVNPFTQAKMQQPDLYYKLHFAQRMCGLQDSINHCVEPNQKAELMLKYAKGLINSVGEKCWPLTGYYSGSFYSFPFFSQYQLALCDRVRKKYESLKNRAFATFTNPERAAQSYADFCMFKTAATKYPDTSAAKSILGHCDQLIDYHI